MNVSAGRLARKAKSEGARAFRFTVDAGRGFGLGAPEWLTNPPRGFGGAGRRARRRAKRKRKAKARRTRLLVFQQRSEGERGESNAMGKKGHPLVRQIGWVSRYPVTFWHRRRK